VTTHKAFKTVEKCVKKIPALLMTLCNDVSSDELFPVSQMIVMP
jgi:hypothetical protein